MGMSQSKFAEFVGQPKATIARSENMAVPIRVGVYFKILNQLKERGIEVDTLSDEPTFTLTEHYIETEKKKYLERVKAKKKDVSD
jgi:transcriptional regulator with XRE-family HTH domain